MTKKSLLKVTKSTPKCQMSSKLILIFNLQNTGILLNGHAISYHDKQMCNYVWNKSNLIIFVSLLRHDQRSFFVFLALKPVVITTKLIIGL